MESSIIIRIATSIAPIKEFCTAMTNDNENRGYNGVACVDTQESEFRMYDLREDSDILIERAVC